MNLFLYKYSQNNENLVSVKETAHSIPDFISIL